MKKFIQRLPENNFSDRGHDGQRTWALAPGDAAAIVPDENVLSYAVATRPAGTFRFNPPRKWESTC